MIKHGTIENGELVIVPAGTEGSKPVVYAPIPDFDQTTQAVFRGDIADCGDYLFVDVVVKEVEQDDETEPEHMF